MRLDMGRLQAFVAIAEEGTMASAAERLSRAQPWLSIQVKKLEDDLGVLLFRRTKGKMGGLTLQGEEFLPIARRLVLCHAETVRDTRRLLERAKRKVVLGVEPISLYIPRRNELVSRFLNLEGVDLELVTRIPSELIDGLLSGQMDMILTCLPVADDTIEHIEIHSARLELAVPKAAREKYRDDHLEGRRLLTMPEQFHPAHHWWVKDALARYDVEWVDCPEMSLEALIGFSAMMGLATVTPDFSANVAALQSDFDLQPIPGDPLTVRWALMRRRGEHTKPAERLWKLTLKMLAEQEG